MMALRLVGLFAVIAVHEIHGQMEACGDAAGSTGFRTVAALNTAAATGPGPFAICPDTILDDDMLRPMVDGSLFLCAATPCMLTTGVVLDADDIRVSIVGVTFGNFAEAVISGRAGSSTTLELRQVVFQDFNTSIAISQANPMRQPFRLEVSGAEVINGFGGVLFSNAGAELSIEDMSVQGSTLMSVVSTANSILSEGSSFLRRILVTESSVDTAFLTMRSADIDAKGVNVNNMKSVGSVFSVTGAGTGARIHDLVVADNAMKIRWTVISVLDQSEVLAEEISVFNSTSLRHVFSAATKSKLTLDKVEIADLMGGRIISPQDVSAVVFSNAESSVSVDRLDVDGISMFTSIFFGNAGSTMEVMRSCAQDGSVQAAAYASEETMIVTTDNYLNVDFGSAVCSTGDGRLVQERPGSGCFQENRTDCAFDCEPFFTATLCRADETDAPTLAPTTSPTGITAAPSPGVTLSLSVPPSSSIIQVTETPTVAGNVTLIPTISANVTDRVRPNKIDIYGDGALVIEQSIDYDTQTVSVTITTIEDSWVGFAFTDSPSMVSNNPIVPTIAVIGIPMEGTVRKYLLGGRSADLVTVLPDSRQTLTNESISQQDGKTMMSFTKPLEEIGEIPISLSGENSFLYAVGSTPELAYHGAMRGYASAEIPVIGGPISMAPSGLPTGEPTKAPSDTDIPTKAPVTPRPTPVPTMKPTKAPITSMPTPTAPFTWPPTQAPSLTPTTSPTVFLLTRNPTHVPTTMLIKATLQPQAAFDGTQMPTSQQIAPNPRPNAQPTHSPLSNRFTPTALPYPTDAPVRYVPIDRHSDDDDDDDGSCDCSEGSEKKGKGKGKSSSKSSKSEGKGEKKKSKKGEKSKSCGCKKRKKRHVRNHQANQALHTAGDRA